MKEEALKLADEIEEWVKAYSEWSGKSKLKEHSDMIRKLVAELDKQGEPVALIKQSKYGFPALVWYGEPIKYNAISAKQDDIPLYTTPQTISDDEVIERYRELARKGY